MASGACLCVIFIADADSLYHVSLDRAIPLGSRRSRSQGRGAERVAREGTAEPPASGYVRVGAARTEGASAHEGLSGARGEFARLACGRSPATAFGEIDASRS